MSRQNDRIKQQQQQSGQSTLVVIPLQKQEQIVAQIRDNLFKVPNEDDIIQDLEDIQKVQELDEKWREVKREQQIQETLITKKKIEKIDNEQKRLAERLEQLVSAPQYDDEEAKYKLIALKRRIEQDNIMEQEKLKEQFLMKKEQELEKVVRKKIEVEQIFEKKKKINDQLLKLEQELQTIDEVKQEKNLESKKVLDKALKRFGDGDQGLNDFSEQDKLLLAENLLEQKISDQQNKEILFKEIQDRLEVQRKKLNDDNQIKLQKLSNLKATIEDKKDKVLQEKAIQGELMKKGIEFIVDAEMGIAPSLQQQRQNIKLNNTILDEYRQGQLSDQNHKGRGNQIILDSDKKILQLRQDMIKNLADNKPYNGSLKPILNSVPVKTMYIIRPTVEALVNYALRKILERENQLQLYRSIKNDVVEREQDFQQQQKRISDKVILISMGEQIFKNVANKILKESVTEISTINSLAQSITLGIIANSLKNERNTKNTILRLQRLFETTRDPKDNHKIDTGVQITFQTQSQLDWKKVKKGKKNNNKDEVQKIIRDKKKKKNQNNNQDQNNNQEDDVDDDDDDEFDINILEPKQDCLDQLGTERIRDYEIFYWEKINFSYLNIRKPIQNSQKFATYLGLSPFKEYIVVGMNNGEVCIYDAYSEPTVIIGVIMGTPQKQAVVDVRFGLDSISNVIILDQQGVVRVCQISYSDKSQITNEQLKNFSRLPDEVQPMFYKQNFQFDYKYFLRKKEQVTDVKDLQISLSIFHPAFSLSTLQPSFMFGANDGSILKFNTNKDIQIGTTYKWAIHNLINCPIIVSEDTPFPEEQSNILGAEVNPVSMSQKNNHIFREFFKGHKSKIIYIGFIVYPENIITVDSAGHVYHWEYDQLYYRIRNKYFKPKEKYKVNIESNFYEPANNDKKIIFPDPTQKNQKKTYLTERGSEIYKDYFENDLYKNLYEKPLKIEGHFEIIMQLKNNVSQDSETQEFLTVTVIKDEKRVLQVTSQQYKSRNTQGQVACVRSSLSNQYVYLEIIKPHQLNTDIIKVEFTAINTNGFRLKKLRPIIEAAYCEKLDFEIVDNYFPFMTSYLFLNLPQAIAIISLSTGSVLKLIQDHLQLAQGLVKQISLNGFQVIQNECIFFTFQGSNGLWKANINDNNEEELQTVIYDNTRFEYEKLFRQ